MVDVILLPDFITERKMKTEPKELTETHNAAGIKKANAAGKPCRRQLKIGKIVKICIITSMDVYVYNGIYTNYTMLCTYYLSFP